MLGNIIGNSYLFLNDKANREYIVIKYYSITKEAVIENEVDFQC